MCILEVQCCYRRINGQVDNDVHILVYSQCCQMSLHCMLQSTFTKCTNGALVIDKQFFSHAQYSSESAHDCSLKGKVWLPERCSVVCHITSPVLHRLLQPGLSLSQLCSSFVFDHTHYTEFVFDCTQYNQVLIL